MIRRFTSLDRPILWGYPSNRFIVLLVVAFLPTMLLLQWLWLGRPELWEALASAGWVFATWALGRELDPDHPSTAMWAALALGSSLLVALPDRGRQLTLTGLMITGILMLCARVTLRSTGRTTTYPDQFALALSPVLAAWLTSSALWPLVLPVALALALDGYSDKNRHHFVFGLILALVSGLLAWLVGGSRPPEGWTPFLLIGVLVLGLVGLGFRTREPVLSPADDNRPLEPRRGVWARAVVMLGSLAVAVLVGLSPLLAVGWVGLFMLARRGSAGVQPHDSTS